MAKYSKGAQKKVERAMKEKKSGTLKSGRSGKKVTSRKQAIAIGLSEARKEDAKVPKKASKKKPAKKSPAKKKAAGKKKSAPGKRASRKGAPKKSASKKSASKRSGGRRRSS